MSEGFRLEIISEGGVPAVLIKKHLDWLGRLVRDYANAHKIKNPQLVVLDLSHGSPYTVTFAVEVESRNEQVPSPIVTRAIGDGIYDISRGCFESVSEWASDKTLFSIPVNTNRRIRVIYVVADRAVTISPPTEAELDRVDITGSITSYEGIVATLNVHKENEYFFHLFTISAPKKVKCIFDSKDLDKVKDSIEQKASITGQVVEYTVRNGFSYPKVIKVSDFEQLSRKDDPPLNVDSLVDQFHTPPGVDSVKWVREIRDEWDDE